MTERRRGRVRVAPQRLCIGPSALTLDGDTLSIEIDERAAPVPRKLKGVVRLRLPALGERTFSIDAKGRHRWRPLAPSARIEADFAEPDLRWRGEGYLDMNQGEEPLEDAFSYWDWSRAHLGGRETAILYNTDPRDGPGRTLALRFDGDAQAEPFDPPAAHVMAPTPVWRIARRTRSEEASPRAVRSFEDTPFYSRSLIAHRLFGAERLAMHEAFCGDRLRSPVVKALLPFRMPRL